LHARWPRRYITDETGPIQNGQPSCHRQFFQNEKNEKSGTTTAAAAAVTEKAKPACAHSRQTCPAATTFFFANRCQWSRGKRWSEKEIGTSDRLVQKRNKSTVHPSIHQSIIREKWTDTPRRFLPTKTHYAYVLSLGRYIPCMCIHRLGEKMHLRGNIHMRSRFPRFPPLSTSWNRSPKTVCTTPQVSGRIYLLLYV
jgi:hypothetical protein